MATESSREKAPCPTRRAKQRRKRTKTRAPRIPKTRQPPTGNVEFPPKHLEKAFSSTQFPPQSQPYLLLSPKITYFTQPIDLVTFLLFFLPTAFVRSVFHTSEKRISDQFNNLKSSYYIFYRLFYISKKHEF